MPQPHFIASLQNRYEAASAAAEAMLERNQTKLKKGERRLGRVLWWCLCAFLLFGLSFVILYPLIYMLSMAFRVPADIGDPAVIWIPKNFTMENIQDAIRFMDYGNSLKNSVLLGVVSSLLQIISCALVGYGLARFHFKGRGLIFGLVIFTIIVPPTVTYTPTYMMYKHFTFAGVTNLIQLITGQDFAVNLIDTPWVLYLPAALGVGIKSGLFIYIFRQFYINLPRELEDAAYIDGCGHVKTFLRIIIPNAGVAFLTVFLFSLVFYWNDYYNVSMYFTNTKTVSTALANLGSAFSIDSAYEAIRANPYLKATRMQAGCLLAITPLLVIYLFLQRYFVTGLERSGLVG